eukprot:8401961-Alexandrium_andersonii.AAC.1
MSPPEPSCGSGGPWLVHGSRALHHRRLRALRLARSCADAQSTACELAVPKPLGIDDGRSVFFAIHLIRERPKPHGGDEHPETVR